MSRLNKLMVLCGDTFENIGEFRKTVRKIWEGEEIELGFILSLERGRFVGLSIDVEEGEYIARYNEAEDGKVTFVALEEVE